MLATRFMLPLSPVRLPLPFHPNLSFFRELVAHSYVLRFSDSVPMFAGRGVRERELETLDVAHIILSVEPSKVFLGSSNSL